MKRISLTLVSLVLLNAVNCFAEAKEEYENIIGGNTNAAFTHTFGDQRYPNSADNYLNINATYTRLFWGNWGLVGQVGYQHADATGGSIHGFRFMAGFEGNFFDQPSNALYTRVMLGLDDSTTYTSVQNPYANLSFAAAVAVGKRFKLFDHFSYSPEIQYTRIGLDRSSSPYGAPTTTDQITIIPLGFAVLF